ncbi:MAG: glycoside hydrolase family 57 protein [Bacteroidaceae bacterium]|nr:glycoside hydrolase family 57 protein [Bacteroidaceae bacterium]
MKTICLYFEIHQVIHLKRYRFFDIGYDHYYYDDYANETGTDYLAQNSYIPALTTLLQMVKDSDGYFKVAFSISGVALEQLEQYAPRVVDLLQELNSTGSVEFLSEPYSHGLSSLAENNEDSFVSEVRRQSELIFERFGQRPRVLRNSSLIYDDRIGGIVGDMGFEGLLTEGAKHILGWKSPHYLYHCNTNPNLKLLLRDFKLSDDISLRFSNTAWESYPLMADTYIDWIAQTPTDEQIYNIFMELNAIGVSQPLNSNILEFLKALPECARKRGITFSTPSQIIDSCKSVAPIDVPFPMSWSDEERDISCWLGNVMQKEAFNKLYKIGERIKYCADKNLIKQNTLSTGAGKRLLQDWDYLQASNNFRFMCTKNLGVGLDMGIYESAYDAFTNYMNILGDFQQRVHEILAVDADADELDALQLAMINKDKRIEELEKQIVRLKSAKTVKTKPFDKSKNGGSK